MTKLLYNENTAGKTAFFRCFAKKSGGLQEQENRRRGTMHMPPDERPPVRRRRRRWSPRRVWNYFVMAVGYLALAYNLIRGIIYLLVLAEEWM